MAPFGSQNLSQEPTQFDSLSEHHPGTVGEQFLKSIVQHPDPCGVGDVGFCDFVGWYVVGDFVGRGDTVGVAGLISISAQLKNCSGIVADRSPSSLNGDVHVLSS